MILPPVKSPLVESIVRKIFPDPVSKRSALSRLSLISFWILMGLVPFSVLLVNQPGKVWVTPKAQSANCIPDYSDARLTNVHSRGFSVHWTTSSDCSASILHSSIRWGDDRSVNANHPKGDPTWMSRTGTHHITVLLDQHPVEGKASIKVQSGDKTYGGELNRLIENGNPIEIFLPADPAYNSALPPGPTNSPGAYSTEKDAFVECPNGKPASDCTGAEVKVCATDTSLCCHKACFRPYPIWGEVKNVSNSPVPGAIVTVSISKSDDGGTTCSNLLSTVANDQGRWVIELANAHKINGSCGFSWKGDEITANFFDYHTDIDAVGNPKANPSKVNVQATGLVAGSFLVRDLDPVPLHSVADAQACATRNTCATKTCGMETPNPLCLTLGNAATDPVITGFTPTSGPVGTTVTINGRNFGSSKWSNSKVNFYNNVEVVDYISWAETEIKVKVPRGATTGRLTVILPSQTPATSSTNFTVTGGGASPTCTSLTLDKTQAAPEDPVKVGVIGQSGSSNFKTTSAITLVALRVSDNSTHGILTFSRCDGVDAKTTPCTDATQGFTPTHAGIPQAGLYKFYVAMVNQEGKTCDDSPSTPAARQCGCGAKELTVTAADAPQISEVRPNRGLRGTEVNVVITGSKLHPEVTYKLSRGSDNINGTVNATPAPSATAVSVKFNIPSSTATGNWNLVATKGTSTASYPFIIVDSAEATVVTFFVELQGLDKSTSPRRQLKVNVGDQDFVVESLPQAQGRYVGAFVLPSSVSGANKEFKVWEPEVRLKRKFSGTVNAGDVNYYDWTGKKILAGDFDGNNKITLADFTGPQGILKPLQTANKISLPITEALKKYDVNGDNALNVLDVSLVLLNFSGLEVPGE